jgi:hypothetical protein
MNSLFLLQVELSRAKAQLADSLATMPTPCSTDSETKRDNPFPLSSRQYRAEQDNVRFVSGQDLAGVCWPDQPNVSCKTC